MNFLAGDASIRPNRSHAIFEQTVNNGAQIRQVEWEALVVKSDQKPSDAPDWLVFPQPFL